MTLPDNKFNELCCLISFTLCSKRWFCETVAHRARITNTHCRVQMYVKRLKRKNKADALNFML